MGAPTPYPGVAETLAPGAAVPASQITGQVAVANGGTGLATLTAHAVQVGNAAGTVTQVGPDATATHALFSAGAAADPTFRAIAAGDVPALPASQITGTAVVQARQVISGGGLTGGGDLSADRTLAVGAGTGITVNADDVAITATGVTAATYGDASHVAAVAVNAQGQITSATAPAIAVDAAAVTSGTLPIARGGTAGATASDARTALGLAIGTNVQAWDADLDALATGKFAVNGATGVPTKVNNETTAGVGTSYALGAATNVASSGAGPQSTTITTFTPAATGLYEVGVTAAYTAGFASDVVSLSVDYKDAALNAAKTQTLINSAALATSGVTSGFATLWAASGTAITAYISNSSSTATICSGFIRRVS